MDTIITNLTLNQMHEALRITEYLTLDAFFASGLTMSDLNQAYLDMQDTEIEIAAQYSYNEECWDDYHPWFNADYGIGTISYR